MAALEKINQVNVEKEKEENAKIELSPEAAKYFKLKFPNAKTPQQERNGRGQVHGQRSGQPQRAWGNRS